MAKSFLKYTVPYAGITLDLTTKQWKLENSSINELNDYMKKEEVEYKLKLQQAKIRY